MTESHMSDIEPWSSTPTQDVVSTHV